MSPSRLQQPSPWPAPTQVPELIPSFDDAPCPKRRRTLEPRQIIADQADVQRALNTCQLLSGNDIFSCFPTTSTVIPQHEWATFVWNSRRPELTQTNLVDIFLFRADSQEQILHFPNRSNPTDQAGFVRAQVDDSWFGAAGQNFDGQNVSFPFYWVIIRSDKTLDGNEVPQPIFTAVQTTVLDSVASSSAAAASSSSALAASLSSLSALSTRTSNPGASTASPSGNVQSAASSSSFPRWAIAVIVVLGFLAIVATCILTFLIIRRIRRRRQRESSNRNSIGSASPMIKRDGEMVQRYDEPASPLLPPPSIAAAGAAAGAAHSSHAGATSTTHDGASTISDSGGPFSGADAAIMADAFRKMLRKPDFAERPVEEGESPEQHEGGNPVDEDPGSAVLSRELAEEGRDIRSVGSSRGVKVESVPHSEAGDPR